MTVQPTIGRRFGIGLLAASAALLTGCAQGQHAQTANQTPAIDGVNGAVGSIQLHIVAIKAPANGTTSYPVGADVQLTLVVVDTGTSADTLTGVTSPDAKGWGVFSSQADAEAVAALATVTPAASPAPILPTPVTSVTIPAGGSVTFGVQDDSQALTLLGLTKQLYTGNSEQVTFTFQNAGSVTVTVPVQLSTSAVGSTIPAPSASQ